jgi:outer membrane protein OmpA-like peptidoglycan-associated protein
MITDEQLATALVAKMAGMELTKVDANTITQSSTGPATKIDPKNFLPGAQQMQQNQQQRVIEELNRQAMMAHPLPQQQMPVQQAPIVQAISVPQPQTFTGQDPNQLTFDFIDEATQKKSLKQLDLIVDYLYSINNKLDKILSRDKHSVSQ